MSMPSWGHQGTSRVREGRRGSRRRNELAALHDVWLWLVQRSGVKCVSPFYYVWVEPSCPLFPLAALLLLLLLLCIITLNEMM